jgi:hypothetical protein
MPEKDGSPTELNHNSALWWLPRLQQTGDGMIPQTLTVFIDYGDLLDVLDGMTPPSWAETCRQVRLAAEAIGYPVFVRSDFASAKHDGPGSYRMDGPQDAQRVVAAIVEDATLKDLGAHALLVREWLDLDAGFKAFNNHPIAKEFRVFVDAIGGFQCIHPYWPADAIFNPDREDWREILAKQSNLPGPHLTHMYERAMVAAQAMNMAEDGWSVDFAFGAGKNHGGWWLIDMAVAEESWHPDHGPRGGADQMGDTEKKETVEKTEESTQEPEGEKETSKETTTETETQS